MTRFFITTLVLLYGLSCAGLALSQEKDVISMMSVKQRLERMERLVSSDVLMEQGMQMEALREEITALREQIDQQGYELDMIKQRQRSLYLDMDRRLQNVETGSPSSSRGAPPVPPPSTGGSGVSVPPPVVSGADDGNGKQSYDKAFSLLKEGRYQQSVKAFEAFLSAYPQSRYADNAQYWLGEGNYANREYKQALSEFQSLVAKYPESQKIAGARLKIGYVYYELKNWSAARESLQQLIKLFPDTSVAKKAQERLDRIKREGH